MRYADYLQHLEYNPDTKVWTLATFGVNDDLSRYVNDLQHTEVFDDLAIDSIDGVWLQRVPPSLLPTQYLVWYREQKVQEMAYNIAEGRAELAALKIEATDLERALAVAEQDLLNYLTED